MKMFKPRRQHPLSIVLRFVRSLKDMAFPLLILFFTSLGGNDNDRLHWFVSIGSLLFLIYITWAVLSWWRFTYHVQGEELRIEHGVIIRNKRYIRKERIQTIHFTQGILHRLFHVVKVEIDTAGGDGQAEAHLAAVTHTEAQYLRNVLSVRQETKRRGTKDKETQTMWQKQLSFPDLLIAASTSGSFGIVFSIILAGLTQLDQLLPDLNLFLLATRFVESNWSIILLVIPLIALLSWMIAVIRMMVQYAHFTLIKQTDELKMTRGLFEKRELTIPIKRIQAIRIVEGWLRQPFGFATIYVESAGYGENSGESAVLFPLLRKRDLHHFLQQVTPEYTMNMNWERVPKRALPRYLFRILLPTLLGVIPVAIFIPWGEISLILIPLAVLLGYLRYRDAGYDLQSHRLALRFRKWSRTTVIVPKRRIQSSRISRSPVQTWRQLSTYGVTVISGAGGAVYAVTDISRTDAEELLQWASQRENTNSNPSTPDRNVLQES